MKTPEEIDPDNIESYDETCPRCNHPYDRCICEE